MTTRIHPATSTDTPRTDAEITVWSIEIQAEVRRIAASKWHFDLMDADDVASAVVEAFFERPEHYMIRYPSALVFARAVARNAGHNWQRSERAQRGQGADLVRDEFGGLRPAREVVSLDVPVFDGAGINFLDRLRADDDIEATVIDNGGLQTAIEESLDQLGAADRDLLVAIYLVGRDRAEVVRQLGCSDAAFRQRLARARRQFIDAFERAAELHVAVLVPLAG